MGYLQACEDADRRIKKRQHQWRCPHCQRWVWEEYMRDFTGAIRDDNRWRELEKKQRERNRQRGIYRGRSL